MKSRATYSKDYKKGQELKKIRETCKAEDRRCLIILKTIILPKIAYTNNLDEVSRLNSILKEFENQINNTKEDK
jgi:hypothetical protein